jgi:hypothetical protein
MRIATCTRAGSIGVATSKNWVDRILDIYHVKTTPTSSASTIRGHDIKEPRFSVCYYIVGAEDLSVCHIWFEIDGFFANTTKSSQVEDLHTVSTSTIRDDIGVFTYHLNISPDRGRRSFSPWKIPNEPWCCSVCHINEGRTIATCYQSIPPSEFGVCPTPNVVDPHASLSTEVVDSHVRDEFHISARELCHLAAVTTVSLLES